MRHAEFFSATYSEARGKFLDACTAAGAVVKSLRNPNAVGPQGEALYTDVARFGPAESELLFIAASATHGVEGFCGSGCQVGFMRTRSHEARPAGSTLLLIHAMNPYGFAHVRRVNEENIDLNRNFVDHSRPHPASSAYDEIHPLILPDDWDGPARASADRAIAAYIAERGMPAFQSAMSGGQYAHSDGVFFGGRAPAWSNKMWRGLLAEQMPGRRRVAFLDLHTGLGPYGYGEPIFLSWPDMAAFERARQWYGTDVTAPEAGTSTSAVVRGVVATAFADLAAPAEITGIALEFGTMPVAEVLGAVRADNWLYARGDPSSPRGREIKRQIRDAFYCDKDDWKGMVFERADAVLREGFAGLGS
ncbi:MAG: DUF2817 domain-containing protein [Alphaproteobacteria bacterium]|nr:DUF2817 domain-containing protein [Alphaproteobacteria bacterium]